LGEPLISMYNRVDGVRSLAREDPITVTATSAEPLPYVHIEKSSFRGENSGDDVGPWVCCVEGKKCMDIR